MYRGCIGRPSLSAETEPLRTVSCLYTSTRGAASMHARHCARRLGVLGHGLSTLAAIGEAIAVDNDQPCVDLSPFSFERTRITKA